MKSFRIATNLAQKSQIAYSILLSSSINYGSVSLVRPKKEQHDSEAHRPFYN